MHIPSYEVLQEFARHGPYIIYRGRRRSDQQAVLLKAPAGASPNRADSEALERQFELLRKLSVAGIPRVYAVVPGDRTCLVLEDRGLTSLRSMLSAGRLDLPSVFTMAIGLCTILDELHRHGLTHGAISPSSTLVSPGCDDVQLLNVGLAPGLWADGGAGAPSGATYVSPEQTGRVNRTVDYRTDFYSFGVTLYEALTGAPPFASDDSLELIHAHIAKMPAPPTQVDAAVPEQVSRIVLRLLAKAAEDRYQSALGLKHDLERCLRAWTREHTIPIFDLATQDISDRFLIPQKLYGRDRELADLLGAFDDTCNGGTALMLVSGYSGIGKTSLIHELYRPIVRQGGYFITGKFDQVVRNIPYGAVAQALRSLVWQLLTESEERLAQWRARLSGALGANGGVLAAVIPEIELIVGVQVPPPPLDSTEARNRFGYVFQRFVGALADREHPLVIFLDDLQWVDAATLDLLHALLTGPDIRHLLLVGAYRDNEVDAGHLLTWAVDKLESSGARVSRLWLGPLALPDLTSFVSDTLHRETRDVAALAGLIRKKTDGNPFFVIQFLKTLEQEGHFVFDHTRTGWSFQMDAIAGAGITDNVVDLMTRTIRRLSAQAQRALTLAACIGNQFDLDTYVTVSRQSPDDAARGLAEAADAGLIQLLDDQSTSPAAGAHARVAYSFLHDRVQQAAYGLIPDAQKKPVHLDVGRLLLADLNPDEPDDRIFTIINHLNIGGDLVTSSHERRSLARLNLAAGRKAKLSAAYRAAVEYLEKGAALLDESRWRSDYELMFSVHVELAECLYLAGSFEAAENAFRLLLDRAATPLDRAHVHGLRITLYENQSRWVDAVSAARDGLALFGIVFPLSAEDKQNALDRDIDAVQQQLGTRAIPSLDDLPEMIHSDSRMIMRILTSAWAPAYISGDQSLARLMSAAIVRLSLMYGNTEDSAYGYVTYAIIIGPIRRDYRAAYEWGELALRVNKRFDDVKRRAKIHQQFQAHVNLWSRPFETCIAHARIACQSGLESGDFPYAGYGAATEAWSAWLINRNLDHFVHNFSPTLALLEKLKMTDFRAAHQVMLNWALALQGRTVGPLSLSDATFDESRFIEEYERTAPFFLTFVYTSKLHLCVLRERYAEALVAAQRAQEVAVTGTIWPVLIAFWGALAAAAAFETAAESERPRLWDQLVTVHQTLAELADSCPENFRCFFLLVSADMKRLTDDTQHAAQLCEEAIGYARHTNNLQQEALANEQCGKLWLQHDEVRARPFLNEAYRCYADWGATSKLAQMEERYGHVLARHRPNARTSFVRNSEDPQPAFADIATVLKVARAIAVEIEVSGLLKQLMKLALQNAGAQRGVFFHEREGTLVLEAEAAADGEDVRLGPITPLNHVDSVALTVVRYVHRTGRDVVIGDAAIDERFAADGYIARVRPKSILCVPVGHQGRLGGILYLENNLTTEVFTVGRIEMMRILAAQTAIALENARLFDSMKREVERRTAAEQALRGALSEVEALKNRLEAENVYLQEEIRTEHNFVEIIGNSPALMSVLHKVEQLAPTDATVLILGETGTGKESIARAIHDRSPRKGRALVKVNCSAISAGLVESELFGHVKGAFTGAIERRVGRFELADGGTIFLDEIGELPADTQVKLLRVLQEQEFEPVGSNRTMRVNVRIIAATNRNLEEAVKSGRFRADLFYRLNVVPVSMPSLRERPSDIPQLTTFFLDRFAKQCGRAFDGVSKADMDRLSRYPWPGNVRELQNVIERSVVMSDGPLLTIDASLVPAGPPERRDDATDSIADAFGEVVARHPKPVRLPGTSASLANLEREHIESILKQTGWVIEGPKGAATILSLHPNTLRSRLKKLGIVKPATSERS